MKTFCTAIAIICAVPQAFSYELATHARLTWEAYRASQLNTNPSLRRDIGVDWYLVDTREPAASYLPSYGTTLPFRSTYFDTAGIQHLQRGATTYEAGYIRTATGQPPLTMPGWLMRGAVREDDSGILAGIRLGEPLDDPYGNLNRWCNHFFDPTKPAGSRQAGFYCPDGMRDASNWAAGTVDLFGNPAAVDSGRRNHFTIRDAREAQYRAVTGRSTDGTNAGMGGLPDAGYGERKAYYATMFRALGDVLHLNQDMAQPQHTRNEPHGGWGYGIPIFEKYMDARAMGEARFRYLGVWKDTLPPLEFPAVVPVRLGSYGQYWLKGDGTGLAEYSNRNFFSPSNNFGDSNYSLPPAWNLNAFLREQIILKSGLRAVFLKYNGVRVARQGALGGFLPFGYNGGYTIDFDVQDAMAENLLPMAVANSAGLLDFYFRGKLQIQLPDEGVYGIVDHAQSTITNAVLVTNNTGFKKIKLKLSAPQTGYDGQPQKFGGGVVLAVMKFRRNLCFKNDASGNFDLSGMEGLETQQGGKFRYDACRTAEEEVVVSSPANGGALFTPGLTPTALTFDFPKALPVNATDVRLQVVFRGQLGTESDAVVVATQDVADPSFFSYLNASDYYTVQTGSGLKAYTRAAINANQTLLQAVSPSTCIDTSVSPNQLKPSCLQPFNIDLGFTIGNGVNVKANGVPPRRFVRFAVLGNADGATSLGQLSTNTCLPRDTMTIDGLEWQDNPVLADNTARTTYPDVLKTRGLYVWAGTSCVGKASSAPAGTPDNRDDPGVMTELSTEEKLPWMVQITGF